MALLKSSNANTYIHSLLCPWDQPSPRIPDTNITFCVPKTVTFGSTYTVESTRGGCITFQPGRPDQQLRLYKLTNNAGYVYYGTLSPDEPIYDSYSRYRVVSAGLKVQCATISAGNFAVAGTFNAANVQQLPNMSGLQYSTLVALRVDDLSAVVQGGIADGVVYVPPPLENHEFSSTMKNDVGAYDSGYNTVTYTPESVYTLKQLLTVHAGVLVNGLLAEVTLNVDRPCNGGIQWRCNFRVVATVTGSYAFQVRDCYWTAATDTALEAQRILCDEAIYLTAGAETTLDFHGSGYVVEDINAIKVFVTATPTAGAVLTAGAAGGQWSQFNMSFLNVSGRQATPAAIIAWQGVDVSNQMTFSGLINYEAVPNNTLIQNVKITAHEVADPSKIARAQTIYSMRGELGIRTMYDINQYRGMVERLAPKIVAAESVGMAAGGGMFRDQFRRALGGGLSFLGGGLRALGERGVGNPSTMSLLANLSGNAGQALQGGGHTVGYAASPVTMESLMAMIQKLADENRALKDQVANLAQPEVASVAPVVGVQDIKNIPIYAGEKLTLNLRECLLPDMLYHNLRVMGDPLLNKNMGVVQVLLGKFPVLGANPGVATALWTHMPLAEHGVPHAYDSRGGGVFLDRVIKDPEAATQVTTLCAESTFMAASAGKPLYVTIINSPVDSILGTSMVACFQAMANGQLTNAVVTGCQDGTQVQMCEEKITLCRRLGLPLIIKDSTRVTDLSQPDVWVVADSTAFLYALLRFSAPERSVAMISPEVATTLRYIPAPQTKQSRNVNGPQVKEAQTVVVQIRGKPYVFNPAAVTERDLKALAAALRKEGVPKEATREDLWLKDFRNKSSKLGPKIAQALSRSPNMYDLPFLTQQATQAPRVLKLLSQPSGEPEVPDYPAPSPVALPPMRKLATAEGTPEVVLDEGYIDNLLEEAAKE